MNPSVSEILTGALNALSDPPPPESAGEFTGGKVSVIALLSFLCAQEAESGAAVRAAENRSMRLLFGEAARNDWAQAHTALLAELGQGHDGDLHISALDQANAELRRALIKLQAAVEDDPEPAARPRERRIAALLLDFARARDLKLPGQ